MKFNIFKVLLFVAVLVVPVACGPDWNDCGTCSVNNPTPPTTPPPTDDAGTPVVDAGTPPCDDAGVPLHKVCKNVCTCYGPEYKCTDGHSYKSKPTWCATITCSVVNVCTHEEQECHLEY